MADMTFIVLEKHSEQQSSCRKLLGRSDFAVMVSNKVGGS